MRIQRSRSRLVMLFATVVVVSSVWTLPALADLGFGAGDVAQVAYTSGDGVNVRVEPGVAADIITTLPEASAVTILDGPLELTDGTHWYEIVADVDGESITGWASATFIGWSVDPLTASPPDEPDDLASGVPIAVSAGGDELNIRAAPSLAGDVIMSAPDGASVEVLEVAVYDDAGNAWSYVRFDGVAGYALADYLGPLVDVALDSTSGVELADVEDLAIGVLATVAGTSGDGVNLRQRPNPTAAAVHSVLEGEPVWIAAGPRTDAAGDIWFQVADGNTLGWVHSAYLSAGGVDVSTGGAIVGEALAYAGVPYLWAGTTPDGFDCSGFTWYVLNQVLANDFPRPMEEQVVSGTSVAPEELLAGDLVFFQNTYQWGLSHVGFYLGDGRFVNAGSEHDAVGISSLTDPYWQARYVTARRVR